MTDSSRIVIFGAGNVGCYVGGRLLSAGADVRMIGRPRLQQLFEKHPLTITDYKGFEFQTTLKPGTYSTDPADASDADLVIVTTKSGATEEAGRQLADVLKPGTPVISLQNGISNADRLREQLPECVVLAGMIPFNVLQKQHGHFHQGTEGHLMATRHPALEPFLYWFQRAGIPLEERDDMPSVMWSKLLLNLNNPINALSGVPLQEELSQRDYRRCLALAQQETLKLKQAGFESGLNTVLTVLDAERDLYAVRNDYATARYDYLLNGLRLKALVGALIEDDLKAINRWLQI